MVYDLIGDIHGYCQTLEALLRKLGYTQTRGVYAQPERTVVFLGDFIDRGPFQREVIALVRPMVETGAALAVMGNHEFNAIAYYTPDGVSGGYLRQHTDKNCSQHRAFLQAYEDTPEDYQDVIDWFSTLPLWLDLGSFRVVHACWNQQWVERIVQFQNGSSLLGDALLQAACTRGQWQYEAIETLLKGQEIPLKEGVTFKDKDGHERHQIRVRWWDQDATTYRKAFMGPESAVTHIPDDEIAGDHLVPYRHDAPPVFLGHYWLEGEPRPLAKNIACLDYSVAKPGGKLVAYRWDGEQELQPDKFVSVPRLEH